MSEDKDIKTVEIKKQPYLLWAVFGEEATVLGLVLAKTKSGALKRFSEETGLSRHQLYVNKLTISRENKVHRFPYRR